MEKESLISIIVPVFNVEAYLSRCLRSICGQTWHHLEIIVVDDGSTDNSLEICHELARQDRRIRLIRQTNQGQSCARNAALQVATGEFIGFVDADDWIEPDMYASLYNLLTRTDADIAVCSYFTEQGDRRRMHPATNGEQILDTTSALHKLAEDKTIRNYLWDKLYRRELFGTDLRFPEGRWFEDIAIMYRLFHRAKRIAVSDKALYHYTIRQGSTMQSLYNAEKEYHLFQAVCEQNDFYLQHRIGDRTPVFVVQRGLRLIDHLLPLSSPRAEEIRREAWKQMIRYDHLTAAEIGWSFAFKRWSIRHCPELYRTMYCLFRKICPSRRHHYPKKHKENE